MEKQLSLAAFWLGVISVVLTIILRGLAFMDVWPRFGMSAGAAISYMTFFRGSVMFFLLSIAAGLVKKPNG